MKTFKYITKPQGEDGIGFCDGEYHELNNVVIDLSKWDGQIDEALSFTRGSNGIVKNSIIRGTGKLCLIGSGDKKWREKEKNNIVIFDNCIFENFYRRGPEVQSGMKVHLNNCLIRNWGDPRFENVRSFGAWAHDGGQIIAINCIFLQDFYKSSTRSYLHHIGNAINEEGLKGLLRKSTWISGQLKALYATNNGYVEAINCYFSDGLYVENAKSRMSVKDAIYRLEKFRHFYLVAGPNDRNFP